MNVRTTDLLPGDVIPYAADITDELVRCPVHVGGIVYALDVRRVFAGGRGAVYTTRYAGCDAIFPVVRP